MQGTLESELGHQGHISDASSPFAPNVPGPSARWGQRRQAPGNGAPPRPFPPRLMLPRAVSTLAKCTHKPLCLCAVFQSVQTWSLRQKRWRKRRRRNSSVSLTSRSCRILVKIAYACVTKHNSGYFWGSTHIFWMWNAVYPQVIFSYVMGWSNPGLVTYEAFSLSGFKFLFYYKKDIHLWGVRAELAVTCAARRCVMHLDPRIC